MERLKVILVGGLLGATLVAGAILFYNRGAKPTIEGVITDVRTLGMERNASVAIVNFDARNTSDNLLIIHDRFLEIVDAKDNRLIGTTVSGVDLKGLFEYFPILGGMKDEPLLRRIEVEPGEEIRGLLAARFEIPKHDLDLRKQIIMRVVDGRGRSSEIRLRSDRE